MSSRARTTALNRRLLGTYQGPKAPATTTANHSMYYKQAPFVLQPMLDRAKYTIYAFFPKGAFCGRVLCFLMHVRQTAALTIACTFRPLVPMRNQCR